MLKSKLLKISLIFAITIFSISIFSGCDKQKKATGFEDEIYVIADTADYYELEPALLQVYSKIIYTPQPENLFNLKRYPYESLEKYKSKKNIIIVCPLNTGSELSKYIESILDDKVKKMVEDDSVFYFTKYDLWAQDQLVMIITGKSDKDIYSKILNSADNMLYAFQKISDKRLNKTIYNEKYENKKVEAKLLNSYNWLIFVQTDFLLALDKPEDRFVWLRRAPGTDMERWVFVHWIENANPNMLSNDSIYVLRNKITQKFYKTSDDSAWVEINDDNKTSKEVNFNGYYAIMTQGLWRFNDNSGGGPFITYTFYDEKTKRLYMIDGSIYAPKYYKKKLIHQVDVLLQSFMPGEKVPKEKREDILDYLPE